MVVAQRFFERFSFKLNNTSKGIKSTPKTTMHISPESILNDRTDASFISGVRTAPVSETRERTDTFRKKMAQDYYQAFKSEQNKGK
eukprot:Pgem_evm1s12372